MPGKLLELKSQVLKASAVCGPHVTTVHTDRISGAFPVQSMDAALPYRKLPRHSAPVSGCNSQSPHKAAL